MACTIIRPKDRQEWLHLRGFGIGSSEVGTILGVNPWETPLQLWRRKMGIDPPKEENFAMRAGHYLEDAVSKFFADETDAQIIKSSAGDWLMVDTDKPYLRVSPDRTFWLPTDKRNEENKGILECKTTRMSVDGDYLPKSWYCQLQYQLHVSGYKHGALAWLVHGSDFDYRKVTYDANFCGWMIEEVDKFWHDNILGKQEPAPITAEDVILQSPSHTIGKTIVATDELLQHLSRLRALREDIKTNEGEAKEIEDALKIAMGDAEALTHAGKTLVTWKASRETKKFDSKRFAEEHPDMYNDYTTTQPGSRRFLIK